MLSNTRNWVRGFNRHSMDSDQARRMNEALWYTCAPAHPQSTQHAHDGINRCPFGFLRPFVALSLLGKRGWVRGSRWLGVSAEVRPGVADCGSVGIRGAAGDGTGSWCRARAAPGCAGGRCIRVGTGGAAGDGTGVWCRTYAAFCCAVGGARLRGLRRDWLQMAPRPNHFHVLCFRRELVQPLDRLPVFGEDDGHMSKCIWRVPVESAFTLRIAETLIKSCVRVTLPPLRKWGMQVATAGPWDA